MAEREAMEFDVLIVGAGPAGLAAAIRLKQVAPDATVLISYTDTAGVPQTLTGYRLDVGDRPALLQPALGSSWPFAAGGAGSVSVTLQAGYAEGEVPAEMVAAILAIVGVVNLPIIKFSVDWWNTLHQPSSVLRLGGPTMAPSMLWPLLFMALVFKLYFVSALLLRIRARLAMQRLDNLRAAISA